MIDISVEGIFAGACLALTLTPGLKMLLIASQSFSQGKASGFSGRNSGGTYCHTLAAALGLSQLLINIPDAVRSAGAAYLPFLAWKAFTSSAPSKLAYGALTLTTLLRIFGKA
ncbi:hypothetical protein [Pseudomonas syringae pv. coryli]|uniref:hypothetical protein n=1 Tax=Pseudomonas syringae pv. coryli TaxID=317659 RepID=UPI001F325310|nr:hypothetical protein [Pseudomonas syringae pv. coryli]